MKNNPYPRNCEAGIHPLVLLVIWLSLVAIGQVSIGYAQTPPPPRAALPDLPEGSPPLGNVGSPLDDEPFGKESPFPPQKLEVDKIPRPIAPFIAGLRANDAVFEVLRGEGRILSTKEDITAGRGQSLIAVGDPSVIDFEVLTARQIRVTGLRLGVTDLSITTAGGQTLNFQVRVVTDLETLSAMLKQHFADANLRLAQVRNNVIVEGQARDAAQVSQIVRMIDDFLKGVEADQETKVKGQGFDAIQQPKFGLDLGGNGNNSVPGINDSSNLDIQGKFAEGRVINLIHVPGSQQVLLKVRVAELNRTALRSIGANFLGIDPKTGSIVGTQIADPTTAQGAIIPFSRINGNSTIQQGGRSLVGSATLPAAALTSQGGTTVFGIFQDKNFEFTLSALRRNSMLRVLAEPNLVALHGHVASFLAGGEFPVPVPQAAAGGVAPAITIRFKEFGVRLNFLPFILDGDVIRLSVAPEVSQIDFTIATTLVSGGSPVPGLNTRKAQTTVELLEGQTLAIAGLLQLELNGTTTRIPGLGDLPVIGPFFSNTSSQRIEKELVVLVTPYLVEPMNPGGVPPTPGDEVKEPNDMELYFLNRIEGRTGKDFRGTTAWDDPFHMVRLMKLERKYLNGPNGFSD